MSSDSNEPSGGGDDGLEMPAPTFWPIVLAAGITMLAMGLVTSWLFSIVGAIVFVLALANWLAQLLPGRGHLREEFVRAEERPRPIAPHFAAVEHLRPGMAGHRLHFPEKMHPYSAGVKGGVAGGIAMTIPAVLYGLLSSHHSLWFPINLLAGMVINLPRLPDGNLDIALLSEFRFRWLFVASIIHVSISLGLGLINGVLLPMLPGRPILWSALVAPLLWTGAVYGFMGVINRDLQATVWWPSFIAAQFVYGLVVGAVVMRSEKIYVDPERRARVLTMVQPPRANEGNP